MREERLIKRIQDRDEHPERREKEDPKRTVDSVIGYLQQILNTRQGSVQIAEDFGIPDFSDFMHTYPESKKEFEKLVNKTILRFEPRLKDIRINFVPKETEDLNLQFQINASLMTRDNQIPVMFVSILDSDGRVRIK